MLVPARLRHVSVTKWGTYKFMYIQLLYEMDQEAAYSAACMMIGITPEKNMHNNQRLTSSAGKNDGLRFCRTTIVPDSLSCQPCFRLSNAIQTNPNPSGNIDNK